MSEMELNKIEYIKEGREKGATHVIDVCDTFDNSHYPVFVMKNEFIEDVKNRIKNQDMTIIYADYLITYDKPEQQKLKFGKIELDDDLVLKTLKERDSKFLKQIDSNNMREQNETLDELLKEREENTQKIKKELFDGVKTKLQKQLNKDILEVEKKLKKEINSLVKSFEVNLKKIENSNDIDYLMDCFNSFK